MRQLIQALLRGRGQLVTAGAEQQLRLHHEAVADDLDIAAVAENGAQLAEEIGTVALQLVDLVRQREVQLLAQLFDAHILGFGLGLGQIQRRGQFGQLGAQRGHLPVQQLHLGGRLGRKLGLSGEFVLIFLQLRQLRGDLAFQLPPQFGQRVDVGSQFRDFGFAAFQLGLGLGQRGAGAVQIEPQGIALAAGTGQRGREFLDGVLGLELCLLFHRQGLGQLRQFQIQRGQSLVAAAERIRQHELTDGEDHQHEHQHHQQRAQGVDKARPEIDRTAATGGEGAHDGRL